ncbi:hypothetical protein EAH76_00445 [Sphingomonas glacialis]|uniref:Uncharacterized protein n=1 Tax=Sphingomonas glacialis TaxID=658225 RepID=A0A502G2S2_9SPHN|nr:hypothetical protein EAH76_00445 [Sphingomonas glacialis]
MGRLMRMRVRRPAILFAIGSAIYWESVAAFLSMMNPLAGHNVAPFWMVAMANCLPAALYAVITLFFCHWLARRIVRDVTSTKGD